MPTSKEPSKQPSRPRKSTRTSKSVAATSETEVPLTATADGHANGDGHSDSFDSLEASAGNGVSQSDDIDGRIRQRAYEIYQARGYSSGNELEDWLEAERQVRTSSSSKTDGIASDNATA